MLHWTNQYLFTNENATIGIEYCLQQEDTEENFPAFSVNEINLGMKNYFVADLRQDPDVEYCISDVGCRISKDVL